MGSNIPFSASAQKSIFFTPTMIPSLALWFDASDQTTITQSSGTVSQWRDKSSNAYSVIQGTASNRPTYATNLLNGLPGIQLSATTYLYQVGSSMPNFSSSPATTVYMVAKNGSTMPNWNIINTMWFTGISGATQRYHFSFGYLTTNGITLFANGSAVVNPSAYVVPLNSNAIIGFSSSATSNFIFYNGSNTAYASSGALPSANNSTWFLFGDARLSTPPVTDENIYEYVGFNTVLTTAQQQAVEGYLATKWGLQSSLSNGHPYKTVPLPAAPSLIYPPVYPTSAVSNPEFDPRIFSGCSLWLDGADPNGTGIRPANGATLTTWQDKSVSNFPFTSAGSAYNTTAVNGLPGITLSTNFFGYDPGSAQNNWQEVFAVGLWTGGSTFNDYNGLVTSSVDSDGGYGGGIIFIGDINTSNWYPIGNTYTTPVLNGTQIYTALPTVKSPFVVRTFSATAVNLRGLRFGIDRSFPTRIWQGFISEVISYNTALSTTQRQQVEAYLAKKWKLTSVLSTQNIYAPGSYLTFVNAPVIPALPMRRAVQSNKFLPSQIAGLQLWLDAADSSTFTYSSGSNISTWIDKSPGANNLTTLTGTPTYTTDGNLKIVNFKSGDLLQSAFTFTITTSSAFFVVAKLTSTSTSYPMVLALPDNNSGDYSIRYSGSVVNYGNSDDIGNGNYFTNGAPNANASFLNLYVIIDTTTATRNASSRISISGSFNSRFFIGNVAEVLVYPGGVNSTQRSQIQGYLGWKWKLKPQFPSDHPFFLIPPVPLP